MNSHLGFIDKIKDTPIIQKAREIKNIRIGTDCSGIEAPIIALELLNIPHKHIFSCDNNKEVQNSIFNNFNPKHFYDNILTRDNKQLSNIDIYICGFPCQSFSTAGNREGFYKKDNQGIIFFSCLEVIKYKKPKFFILENVKGLVRHEKGKTFSIILDHLNSLQNYNIYYKVLNTSDYNIPHKRDRIYIIGIRKDLQKRRFQFPKPHNNTLDLDDILEDHKMSKRSILSEVKKQLVKDKINHLNINRKDNWVINLNASFPYATALQNISPCLVTTCNMFYLTRYNRFLTCREALRLQGFPDDFHLDSSLNKCYKQIGNSMSTNVLCHLYYEIFKSIL
jgi:DNA (cytosine-5)-methyltransferase 1